MCATVRGDAGHANARVCDVQTIISQNGGDWYIGDNLSGTASDNDWWYNLRSFTAQVVYPQGNSMVQWSPTGQLHPSACTNKTIGFAYGGVSIGQSFESCPDVVSPFVSDTKFGEIWLGNTSDAVGLGAVDVVHNPNNVSPAAQVQLGISWG